MAMLKPLFRIFVLATAACSIVACTTVNQTDAQAVPAGLVSADFADFDQAWIRPDADFSEYDAVLIEPAVIEFDPDWGRSGQLTGSRLPSTMVDIDATRAEMTEVIDQALRDQLRRDERFRIVEAAGPNVLRLRPRADELFISAIDPMKMAARTDQYVRSMGHGRAGLEVADSVTDDVLMQVSDLRETRRYTDLQLATPSRVATDFIDWYRRFSEDALEAMP